MMRERRHGQNDPSGRRQLRNEPTMPTGTVADLWREGLSKSVVRNGLVSAEGMFILEKEEEE